MQSTRKPVSRSPFASFVRSPSVWSLLVLAGGLSFFLVWLSRDETTAKEFRPIAEAVLTFTLVGVWFETPWVLSLLARSFLSSENAARLSETARQELRKELQTMRAEASGDPAVVDLADTLAKTEPDFLDPYVCECGLIVTHSPLDDAGSEVLVSTEFVYTAINPGKEPALFGPPFHTTMKAIDLPAGVKLFSLDRFQILDRRTGSVVCDLGADNVSIDVDKQTGESIFIGRVKEPLKMAGGDVWRVYFTSKRVISYHDVFKYVASRRCIRDMHVTYDYGALQAKHPELAPKLWLFTNSAKVFRESTLGGKKEWDLQGWLLRGNGFALSW